MEKQVISTEEPLVQYLSALSAQMIVIPGHPEQGPFFLLKKLLMNLDDLQWEKGSIARSRINLRLIAYLSSIVQTSLPYHVFSSEFFYYYFYLFLFYKVYFIIIIIII